MCSTLVQRYNPSIHREQCELICVHLTSAPLLIWVQETQHPNRHQHRRSGVVQRFAVMWERGRATFTSASTAACESGCIGLLSGPVKRHPQFKDTMPCMSCVPVCRSSPGGPCMSHLTADGLEVPCIESSVHDPNEHAALVLLEHACVQVAYGGGGVGDRRESGIIACTRHDTAAG